MCAVPVRPSLADSKENRCFESTPHASARVRLNAWFTNGRGGLFDDLFFTEPRAEVDDGAAAATFQPSGNRAAVRFAFTVC